MNFKVGDKVKLKEIYKEFVIKNSTGIRDLLKEHDIFIVDYIDNQCDRLGFVETDNWLWGSCWFEKVEEVPKPVFDDIKLAYRGDKTVAMYNGNFGESIRSKHDKEDRKVGILIAAMRALGFKNKTVDTVIDVLFDDFVDVKYLNNGELLQEVQKRMK